MENNDTRIMELKAGIEKKKVLIKGNEKFNPITNCIIIIEGNSYNINVLDVVDLIFLLGKINNYSQTVKSLNLIGCDVICGFKAEDWEADIIAKIRATKVKQEIIALKQMETKLTQLLSEQKKTELELDDIENMLK